MKLSDRTVDAGEPPSTPRAMRLTVVSTANVRYFPGVLVTFHSLLRHLAPGWTVDFKLLTDGLDEGHCATLRRVIDSTGREPALEIIPVDFGRYVNYPPDYGGGRLAYARLLLPSLVEVDRALYVDSDMVITKDISVLTTLQWAEGRLLYAVADQKIPTFGDEEMPCGRIGIPPDAAYFNSGFFWADLEGWRRSRVEDACREYMHRNPDGMRWWDQSILNAVLWRNWTPLDRTWNNAADQTLGKLEGWPRRRLRDLNVHYLGPEKPWLEMNPYRHFYDDCLAEIVDLLPAGTLTYKTTRADVLARAWFFARRGFLHYGSHCKQWLLRRLR